MAARKPKQKRPPASNVAELSDDESKTTTKTTTVFDILMARKPKKQRVPLSNMVDCPAGCGRRLLNGKALNDHLDICLTGQAGSPNNRDGVASAVTDSPKESHGSLKRSSTAKKNTKKRAKKNTKKRETFACPNCRIPTTEAMMNLHLDSCLSTTNTTATSARKDPAKHNNFDETREQTLLPASVNNDDEKWTGDRDKTAATSQESGPSHSGATRDSSAIAERESGVAEQAASPQCNAQDEHSASTTMMENEETVSSFVQTPGKCDLGVVASAHSNVSMVCFPIAESGVGATSREVSPASSGKQPRDPCVFTTMMKNAKTVFSRHSPTPTRHEHQLFHLRANASLSLYMHAGSMQEESLTTCWSATVELREKPNLSAAEHEKPGAKQAGETEKPVVFNLTISSAQPSQVEPKRRWVRRHSRFSVAVLKSFLQKSIRRRRPLPSVRIAMELADRDLGALLRRLPIIILEDTTLHPNFGQLIWLMIAHTKDYHIPTPMMARLFQVVFEVASCPYTDPIPSPHQNSTEVPSLASVHANHSPAASSPSESLVWAILVRAAYGGMKSDMSMLRNYARLWSDRFVSTESPRLDTLSKEIINWHQVPELHQRVDREHAWTVISDLCNRGLECLGIDDFCPEAIDFHCSSVVEHVLSCPDVKEICEDFRRLSKEKDVEELVKNSIWIHSAGVNHRELLTGGSAPPMLLDSLWRDILSSPILAFQKKYVENGIFR